MAAPATRKAVEMALAGDVTALRLCLERILPACKSRRVAIDMPQIRRTEDLPMALAAVTTAMAEGELAVDEASMIANMLEIRRKSIETADHERRLMALEKAGEKR